MPHTWWKLNCKARRADGYLGDVHNHLRQWICFQRHILAAVATQLSYRCLNLLNPWGKPKIMHTQSSTKAGSPSRLPLSDTISISTRSISPTSWSRMSLARFMERACSHRERVGCVSVCLCVCVCVCVCVIFFGNPELAWCERSKNVSRVILSRLQWMIWCSSKNMSYIRITASS